MMMMMMMMITTWLKDILTILTVGLADFIFGYYEAITVYVLCWASLLNEILHVEQLPTSL